MNQGMFDRVVARLDRIIELLEDQRAARPTIIAVPNDVNVVELMEQLNQATGEAVEGLADGAELPKPAPKRSKTK